MNESRLAHPRGFDGRFFVIRAWAVRAVRLEGAAILGLLDYFDQSGIRQVSRKRLLAELDGIAGKGLVASGLDRLLDLGWIKKIEVRLVGDSNRSTAHEFQICPDEINKYLGNPHGYLASRNRNAPTSEVIHKRVPISDPISDLESERPIEEKNNQKKQQQGPVVAFFGAIEDGHDGLLADARELRELLARDLGQASEEQARWAGLAWAHAMAHGSVGNPVGLARTLARMAAAGEVSPPVSVVQAAQASAQAEAAAAGRAAHLAALEASAAVVMRDIPPALQGRKGNLLDILKPHAPAP